MQGGVTGEFFDQTRQTEAAQGEVGAPWPGRCEVPRRCCDPAADASSRGDELGAAASLKILVSIEDPQVIAKILAHLERTAPQQYRPERQLGPRAPPMQSHLL